MDRLRQKGKKEKPLKHHDKGKSTFAADVKMMKENNKIKEILRTVKINSSMRLKAPRGSKVMCNNDLSEEDIVISDVTDSDISVAPDEDPASKTVDTANFSIQNNEICSSQPELVESAACEQDTCSKSNQSDNDVEESIKACDEVISSVAEQTTGTQIDDKSSDISSNMTSGDTRTIGNDTLMCLPRIANNEKPLRTRKLSLDHTVLMRGESFSQSEVDLHSVGKLPLERKSSFFRKKMDSFLKNTSEVFRRQSIKRRGSISYSLQSLNENNYTDRYKTAFNSQDIPRGSTDSLTSTSTMARSSISLHSQGPQDEERNLPSASASQLLGDLTADSLTSLEEAVLQETMLNSRAISMSSGLDTAQGTKRRLANRSKRVTWLASEGLTNYLRRMIQDEKSRDLHNSHSYQDFNALPEHPKMDSRGRRLSYQRAVSGEDPVRHHDTNSLRRRSFIPEYSEANYELSSQLTEFSRNGVPPLQGFCIATINDQAFSLLKWEDQSLSAEESYDWKSICTIQLSPNEEARQAVVKELVTTEMDYIRHLMAIVEVFMAAAHALQDSGKLLDVDTARLFCNVPDILNASLYFWDNAIFPMVADAIENQSIYNTDLMYPGFYRFRDIFQPYEKFVCEQTKALDYLRSLVNHPAFQAYLAWCHSQASCNRLQLSDIMVKPMQRLTKYPLIIRRIISHTDTEPERTTLIAMEQFAKNYVLDLNRTIRQREELEKLDQLIEMIDVFEVDFRDEDMDRLFRAYAHPNLKAPMVGCLPNHSRTLVFQGDLKFKDNQKEAKFDVRAILLTDMLLICKKYTTKNSTHSYKLIRPKYMVDKMMHFPQYSKTKAKEVSAIIFVMIDEVGSAYHSFALSDPGKDSNPQLLKTWEQKLREAKMSYDLGVWFAKNPSRDLSEVEMDTSSDYTGRPGMKQNSEDLMIEREARERVAAMLHRSMGVSTEYDFSQASMNTESFDAGGEPSGTSGAKTPGVHSLRHAMYRTSTGSSRNSRLSSFQQSHSAASQDEPMTDRQKNIYRAGTSVEHLIPPKNPEEAATSITVNVVSESESETMVQKPQVSQVAQVAQAPQTDIGAQVQSVPQVHHRPRLYQLPASSRPPSRSSSHSCHQYTLKVEPQSPSLIHSLPDLTVHSVSTPPTRSPSPTPQSASEKLYQSHQELLNRNRLSASAGSHSHSSHYLSPDHRGTSYPPPSPTRASLRRGLAFSYSFKNPPLSKMGHVNSQSTVQGEAGPSTAAQGTTKDKRLSKGESQAQSQAERERGAVNQTLVAAASTAGDPLAPAQSRPSTSLRKKYFSSRKSHERDKTAGSSKQTPVTDTRESQPSSREPSPSPREPSPKPREPSPIPREPSPKSHEVSLNAHEHSPRQPHMGQSQASTGHTPVQIVVGPPSPALPNLAQTSPGQPSPNQPPVAQPPPDPPNLELPQSIQSLPGQPPPGQTHVDQLQPGQPVLGQPPLEEQIHPGKSPPVQSHVGQTGSEQSHPPETIMEQPPRPLLPEQSISDQAPRGHPSRRPTSLPSPGKSFPVQILLGPLLPGQIPLGLPPPGQPIQRQPLLGQPAPGQPNFGLPQSAPPPPRRILHRQLSPGRPPGLPSPGQISPGQTSPDPGHSTSSDQPPCKSKILSAARSKGDGSTSPGKKEPD